MRWIFRTVGAAAALLLLSASPGGSVRPSWAGTDSAAITLTPVFGPPSTKMVVGGQGFGAQERVDLRFDATRAGRARTDGDGAFTGHVTVPAAALPGDHSVTARGRQSGSIAQAIFMVRTDWPMFQFDAAHSGVNPYENVLDPENVPTLSLAWKASVDPAFAITSSLAVVDGVVYAGAAAKPGTTDTTLNAFSADTGELVWQRAVNDGLTTSGVGVVDGVLYVGISNDYTLRALDAATGGPVWTYHATGIINTPTVANGMVYAGASDYSLYAIDASTGERVWSLLTQGIVFGAPAVANGMVYASSNDANVYAADAETGTVAWVRPTGASITSSPAVVDGIVYVGSDDHRLYALNAVTGNVLWAATTGDKIWSSPAVADGIVYVGSMDHSVYAFDAVTGDELWSAPTDGQVTMAPFVASGVVFIGSGDFKIYGFDALTGQQLWSYATGATLAESGAVVDGRVYTGSQDGYMYAFALPSQ